MSLRLEGEGTSRGVSVDTAEMSLGGPVGLGKYEIDLEDFLAAAWYVLTNVDLREGDPREAFVRKVAALGRVPGWNPGGERLGY